MEKKFVKVRSVKDIVVFTSFVIAGCALALLPESVGANIGGYILILAGFILAFMLKSAYEDFDTKQKYVKKEYFFGSELRSSIEKAIGSNPSSLNLKEEGKGQSLKVVIFSSKSADKAYLQLFEYIPYEYQAKSEVFEYGYSAVEKLV
jgi:hypothetical protein